MIVAGEEQREGIAFLLHLAHAVGWLYAWKNVLLVVIVLLSVVIYRPFCKYICPLGAVYSVFNPIAVFRYRVDKEACVHCGACAKACKMQVDPSETPNHPECIRCGSCKKVCPTGAIYSGINCRKGSETAVSSVEKTV